MLKQQKYYQAADDRHSGGKFCPNCGQPVAAKDDFCGHCGFDLKAFWHKSKAGLNEEMPAKPAKSQPKQPVTTHIRRTRTKSPMPVWFWGIVGMIGVLVIGSYLYGQHYYQPANQLDRDMAALKTGKGLAKQVTSTDPSLKITTDSVKPMVAYFKHDAKALASLASDLKTNAGVNQYGIQFVRTGKAWLFFDKYQLQVPSIYANLTTNHENVSLAVNGKQVAKSTSARYIKKIGPYVPGNYTLTAKGKVGQHEITNKGTHYLHTNGQTVNLDLRTISLTVEGTPDTVIYVNGKKQGKIHSSGTLALNELPWSNHMMMIGKYQIGSKTITSTAADISAAEGEKITVKFPGTMSTDSATNLIGNVFSAVSRYTNTGNLKDATNYDNHSLDDYFVNGTDNVNYQELVKMAKGYYDNHDIIGVSYRPTLVSVVPAADGKSEITYDLKYDFTNTKDERLQVFRYTATVEKNGGHNKISKISAAKKIRDYTNSDNSSDN
ncbi:zinc ribbon domain-containing protein [Lactiplantibacillus brownii]|uniref:zinc ribbon domain-containing protein n=1 Tax=Lactiplantibacillus brownii TaxID=3069269 RepID=UPI0038B31591